ncbi:MAG TPA: YncE family protein [Bacteroidia bacterium]|jgi:DNA-binding beta-propeller fold protein YncE|nr:YncE family protein [Bacteroidia bacterium]
MKTKLLTGLFILTGLYSNAQLVLNNADKQPSSKYYKIVDRIHMPGEMGWDYCAIDEENNTLYVSHGTRVEVIDLKAGKLVDSILHTNGVHGIAIANDLNKGFISDGKDTAVTIFNLKTHAILAKIIVTGKNPDAIVYDKTTHRVFTFNGRSSNSTVIDAKTNTILGTIDLDGKPEFCVADGTGKLFVNIEDKSNIAEIDAGTMKVLKEWSIKPGESPSGLAMDTKNHRLFSVCDNHLMVISDAEKGSVITTVPIGEGPDAAAFDPEKMRIYSSNGEGYLTVVSDSADTYKVLETFKTQNKARTMTIDTKTHHLYLPVGFPKPLPPVRAAAERPKPSIKDGTFVVMDIETVE